MSDDARRQLIRIGAQPFCADPSHIVRFYVTRGASGRGEVCRVIFDDGKEEMLNPAVFQMLVDYFEPVVLGGKGAK